MSETMQTVLITAGALYLVGIVATSVYGFEVRNQAGWWGTSDNERTEELRDGARLILFSPLWPLWGTRWLGRRIGELFVDANRRIDD